MTELLKEKQRAARRHPLAALLALLAAIAVVVSIAGSGVASTLTATCATNGTLDATAVNGGQSNFEIDAAVVGGTVKKPVFTAGANLTLDGASPCLDWTTAAKGLGNNGSLTAGVIVKPDKASGSGDDSFTQGTDENDTTPTIASGSIPPNKSDLQDFGVYRESNSTGKFLDLFWSRVNAPSGTVDMDFELNQKVCDGTAANCSANGSGQFILPLRSSGDRLITYDLANGGTNPTISIYSWSGNSSSGSWANGQVISGGTHEALGSINFDSIATADGGGLGAKDGLTFGEVSVSYKALFGSGGTTGCGSFGSVFLKSRSSNTFTDEMKDFVAPQPVQITNCTSLSTSASNATAATAQTIGGTITDTATLSNAQSPTNGVVFKAFGPFDPATASSGDTCNDSGASANLRYTSSPAIALTGPDASGNYTASVPASGANSFTPAAAGRYEWIASYAADANNGGSGGLCGDGGEQSLVAPVTPAIATTASNATSATAQTLGSAVTDGRRTLTGTAKSSPAGRTQAGRSRSSCTGRPARRRVSTPARMRTSCSRPRRSPSTVTGAGPPSTARRVTHPRRPAPTTGSPATAATRRTRTRSRAPVARGANEHRGTEHADALDQRRRRVGGALPEPLSAIPRCSGTRPWSLMARRRLRARSRSSCTARPRRPRASTPVWAQTWSAPSRSP